MHWVDIFIGGIDNTFRQWPGAVGSLEADVDGLRTYRPTARTWFTGTVSAYGRTDRYNNPISRETFLEKPPLVLSEPYVDAFGRGYLLSLTAPVVAPRGTSPPSVVGVAGADLLIEDLTELITTIRIRSSGAAGWKWHLALVSFPGGSGCAAPHAGAQLQPLSSAASGGATQSTQSTRPQAETV